MSVTEVRHTQMEINKDQTYYYKWKVCLFDGHSYQGHISRHDLVSCHFMKNDLFKNIGLLLISYNVGL